MSANDIKMSQIQSVGLYFAKKSDDLTWNDPRGTGYPLGGMFPRNLSNLTLKWIVT